MANKDQTFQWPEMYSFPPFFTLQKNDETREKQVEMWVNLVVKWCQHNTITEIQVSTASQLPIFNNADINRRLDEGDILTVLDKIATSGYGLWITPDRSLFGISGLKISDVANAIHKWADALGMINNMATLDEINNSDGSTGEVFHGLSDVLVLKALEELASTDRAVILPGDTIQETGVKFLSL